MIDSLLTFLVGKNGPKRRKILQILNTLSQNTETGEFTAKSTTSDKKYSVFYSSKAKMWKCDCIASIFNRYKTFNSPSDRYRHRENHYCIHITSCILFKALKNHVITRT
jgi:hypothetical protein